MLFKFFHFTIRSGCVNMKTSGAKEGPLIMMQTCPKCGFSQPKDRYCANCGLDIETYKPAPAPIYQRLQKNTRLHMALAALLIIVIAGYIYQLEKERILAHLKNAPGFLSFTPRPKAEAIRTQSEPVAYTQEVAPSEAQPATTLAASEVPDATAPTEPQELVISFGELTLQALSEITAQSEILRETDNRRTLQTHSPTSLEDLAKGSGYRILGGGQSFNFRNNTTTSYDFTHISGTSNEDVGLTLDLAVDSVAETGLTVRISGLITLKDESGADLPQVEINSTYNLDFKKSILIVGLLPRKPLKPEDVTQFANTPLSIYGSGEFLSGASDFVIFLRAK
jgi:ribosomal protein L32